MPIFFSQVTATGATTATVWQGWIGRNATTSATNIWTSWTQENYRPEQLAAAQSQQQAQAREYEVHAKAARKRAEEVEARARELLLGYLNERQRQDLATHNWFLVDGKSGVRYRIKRGSLVGNVEVLNADGSVRHRLCAHDRNEGTPLDDQLLTQKLYLEHHEQEFLNVANRHD